MNAELICVGTELLLGHTVNTDATVVAQELSRLGIDLLYAATVGDNPGRLEAAVRQALGRADVVVTTGGLGPTGDDLTKETVSKAAGVGLALHEESLARIRAYFKNRPCGDSQEKQAWLPKGCTVLPNDCGTAPGCAFRAAGGALAVMLPGPPGELTPMLQRYAGPLLAALSREIIVSHMAHCFGIGEGLAAERIADLTQSANPTAATYAKDNEMFVRVTAKAATQAEAEALCRPMLAELRARFGDFLYGIDVDSLEETVVRALIARGETLATAESCTGGLLSKRLTDIAGASAVFHMGIVSYANEVKTALLGVPEALLEEHGAVSEQVAASMAEGVLARAGSTWGIGITGVAGPGGGTPEKPVGLVYIALTNGEHTWVEHTVPNAGRPREYYRNLAASKALDMLRREMRA